MPFPTDHNIDDILAAINATPSPTGDPVADTVASDTSLDWLDHPAADVPMPGESDSTPVTDLASYRGPKASASFRGMTDDGLRRAKGLYGEADQRAAARVDADTAYSQAQADKAREHLTAVGDAYNNEIDRTAEFQRRNDELQRQVIDFNRGAAALEQQLAGEAHAERAGYIAAYKEQLAVVKQLAMQSGNPINQLSRGEAFGLAGAQFAQGFLAAQGINIDVAGQVDRWVDRSIQEHQMKIANARASADDQLHLYQIARQNSQDEWEARQRYRGFVIAGLQTAIQLNAQRFQSDVAMARAQEHIARLQVEADNTERAIGDAHLQRVASIYNSEHQRAYQQGQLAIQQKHADLAAEELAWKKDQAAKKAQEENGGQLPAITDPEYLTDPKTNKPITDEQGNKILRGRWSMNPKVMQDPVLARKVWSQAGEARENYANYLDATNNMIDTYTAAKALRDSAGPLSKLTWNELDRLDKSGVVHRYLQARDAWVLAKVYNDSGKQINENEFKRQSDQAYKDLLLAENGNKGEQSYAQLRENGRKKFERHMESFGFVGTQDPNEGISKSIGASPVAANEDTATLYGKAPIPGFAEKELKAVEQRDSEDIATKDISGAWADFKGYDMDALAKTANGKNNASEAARDYARSELGSGQPEHAVAIDHLALAYAKPGFISRHKDRFNLKIDKDETPEEIRTGAKRALTAIANGEGDYPKSAQEYAQYIVRQIDNDEVLRSVAGDEDVDKSPLLDRLNWRRQKQSWEY